MEYKTLSDNALVGSYGLLMNELKIRKIITSKNLVGDLAEYLAIQWYQKTPSLPNITAAPKGTQNVDAIGKNGARYSIKGTTGKVTGAFWGFPHKDSTEKWQQNFEYLIIVILGEDYQLKSINQLTWDHFLIHKRWHSRMNVWNISVTNKLLDETQVIMRNDVITK